MGEYVDVVVVVFAGFEEEEEDEEDEGVFCFLLLEIPLDGEGVFSCVFFSVKRLKNIIND